MMLTRTKKQQVVASLQKDLQAYPTVALASIQSLPARQYGRIRKKTRDKAKIAFARATLVGRALEKKPELKDLGPMTSGSVLVFSELDAFSLFKLFKQNKSKTGAKAGAIAPSDLVIPAGETSLPPGPVLTELKQAGIQAKIQGPKVVITADAVVTKKGQAVSEGAAKILAKLGIEPMEVGLQIQKVYDHGTWYESSVLDIDEEGFKQSLAQAHQEAINLCVVAGIYNEDSVPLILQKAEREALAVQKAVDSKSAQSPTAEKPAEAAPA